MLKCVIVLWSTFALVLGIDSTSLALGTKHVRGSPRTSAPPAVGSRSRRAAYWLTPEDRAAIRALDATFVDGWLRDDAAAVLGIYAPEAILFPPGSAPLRGLAAIRAYWWPQDGSKTRIRTFDRTIDEIEGTRQLAYLRGTSSLGWTYEKDGHETKQTSRSTDLFLLKCDASGHWRVVRQMWNMLPN